LDRLNSRRKITPLKIKKKEMNKIVVAVFMTAIPLLTSCKKETKEKETLRYQLQVDSSYAEWKGYLRTGYFNEGSIQVKSEAVEVTDGIVSGGTFIMPLYTLKNFNLPTDSLKEQLIHHLMSSDFFDMLLYPELTFRIASVQSMDTKPGHSVDSANFLVKGDFSMLGKALQIDFPAKIHVENGQLSIEAKLKIDRTKWGMVYATQSDLEDEEFIMPEVDIAISLKGKSF